MQVSHGNNKEVHHRAAIEKEKVSASARKTLLIKDGGRKGGVKEFRT